MSLYKASLVTDNRKGPAVNCESVCVIYCQLNPVFAVRILYSIPITSSLYTI